MPKRSIMVIDDDVEFLRAVVTVLNKHGFVAAGAVNPCSAMDYVTNSHQPFDLIITDLSMPILNGIEVLRILKAHFPAVPVIVVTAFGLDDVRAEALREGAVDFLMKPFDKEQLLAAIERALDNAGHAHQHVHAA